MSPRNLRRTVGRRRKLGRAFAEMHYRLRTDGDTPLRKALAVWMGVTIGCLPIWGIHLPLCIGAARLFRLNALHAYLAAHLNNPLTAPFLLYAGYGLGQWMYEGRWPRLSLTGLAEIAPFDAGRSLLVGSLVLGLALGTVGGVVVWIAGTRFARSSFDRQLIDRVAKPYLDSGVLHWEFVCGKLRFDPVYRTILDTGLLPDRGRLVDLGCGRGVLPALIDGARALHAEDAWPRDRPAPPTGLTALGIERRPSLARVARNALGQGRIRRGDLTRMPLPDADVFVLFDVLHYLAGDEQERLLERVAEALRPGGTILIREADADAGWRFTATRLAERLAALTRGGFRARFRYRSAAGWTRLLESLGFEAEVRPMGHGTPYSNVLISGRLLRPRASTESDPQARPAAKSPAAGERWDGGDATP